MWEKTPKGLKHVTLVTCMYGHHGDNCHKEKSRKVGGSILPRPNWNNSWDREERRRMEKGKKEKKIKPKGENSMRGKNGRKKNKIK